MSASESPTRDLASWIVRDLDMSISTSEQREIAAMSAVDTFACIFGGTFEHGMKVLGSTLSLSAGGPASLIAGGTGASPADAALFNGYLAHMLDYDDSDLLTRSHPSCVLIPVTMALAEHLGLGAREMLEAYMVGLQVNQLIGVCATPAMPHRGYHVVGAAGVMGAAAAASRLLRLTPQQAARALGIAASMGAGVRANFGTDIKPFHAGRSAAGGIQAAVLAKGGFTASETILEATDGFISTLADKALIPKLRTETDRLLAGEYAIEKARPVIKLYPCCHAAHAPIIAILRMRPLIADRLDEIREVHIEGPHTSLDYMIYPRPETGLQAKFSNEGCAALTLIDGKSDIAQYSDHSIRRPEVQRMISKIHYHATDEMQEKLSRRTLPGKVTIVMDDQSLIEDIPNIPGCWGMPCDMNDVMTKFIECAQPLLTSAELEIATELCRDFAGLKEVRTIGKALRGSVPVA